MAGNAVIGALRVVLGADTAALDSGLKDARSKLAGFSVGLGTAMAAAGTAVAAAAAAIGVAIKSSINEAEQLNKMSQSIGVPVEELSKLKYAADLSDVSLESLGVSLGKLAKNMSATAGGAGKAAAEAFKAMGIEVMNADGTLRSSSDVLADVAGKFKGYEDGAAKTALAIAVFGKAGASMIPLLNQGKDGLQQATQEAVRYGVVISGPTAAAAEAFNDNLKRMNAINSSLWTQITAQMLPAFLQLSKVMLENKENSALVGMAATGIVTAMRAAVSVAVGAAVVFQRLGAEISALWKVLSAMSWADMKQAWGEFQGQSAITENAFKSLGDTIGKFWKDADTGMAKVGESAGSKMAAPIIQATEKAKNALQSFLDSTQKRTAGLEAEAQTIGKSSFETDKLKISLEALTVAKNNNIPITEMLRQKIDGVATAFATMSEKAQYGKQLFEQTRTPLEQFQMTMENLNGALDRGAISQDTYARAVAQAQDKLVQANPAAQILGNSLETAFGRAFESGAKLSDILRQLLQDLAKAGASALFRQLLYGNAQQGGTSGGILGAIFAGLPGFATGGSIMPGGSGGIDSQLVAFRKSPNERVDITKPGQSIGGGVSLHMPVTIDARGADQAAVVRIGQGLQEMQRTLPTQIAAVTRAKQVRGVRP